MTDLEITRLCAEAMGCRNKQYRGPWDWEEDKKYDPIHDKAQAMALVEKFNLCITPPTIRADGRWGASVYPEIWIASSPTNLNRAICGCVAKMQTAKRAEAARPSQATPVAYQHYDGRIMTVKLK